MASNRHSRRPHVPSTPEVRPGFRNADHTRKVVLVMGTQHVEALDALCEINSRSRREIVEILVSEASIELQQDSTARIKPL